MITIISYTVRRLFMLIPVLFGMTMIVFFILQLIPGNPAQLILGQHATKAAVERLASQLGLDQPWYVQYFSYIKGLFTGDLGTSIRTGKPINEEIWPFFMATIELSLAALIIAIIIGMNAGIISAWFQNSWFDYTAMVIALVGISIPIFWFGLMEQWFFSIDLGWLPSTGRENVRDPVIPITNFYMLDTLIQGNFSQLSVVIKHLILPAFALGTVSMAIIARITRSSMLEVMRSDYIRTARAKGMRMFWVVYKHGLKNAIIPVLTVIGMQMGILLGGAVLTETIFGWPGIGRYIYDAINFRDYPVIQTGILIVAGFFVLINLAVDLLYAAIDPRIKYH